MIAITNLHILLQIVIVSIYTTGNIVIVYRQYIIGYTSASSCSIVVRVTRNHNFFPTILLRDGNYKNVNRRRTSEAFTGRIIY